MDDKRIDEIVHKIFEKAKQECASHARYALSNHIANEMNNVFSYRTPERAYKRYIEKDNRKGEPNEESVDFFCQYLGYENYKGYITRNPKEKVILKAFPKPLKPELLRGNFKDWILSITIILGILSFFILGVQFFSKKQDFPLESSTCMAWVKDHYEEVSCNLQFHPISGMQIVPYDIKLITNFRKIEVTILTTFFSEETGKPLIWYYKNRDSEIEYFTAPGFHPVTGKTLKAITEYIIEKYVPKYPPNIGNDEDDDGIEIPPIVDTNDLEMITLIFNKNMPDQGVMGQLKKTYFRPYTHLVSTLNSSRLNTYRQELLSGNPLEIRKYVTKNVDYICVGFVEYLYSNKVANVTTCDMRLNFNVYSTKTGAEQLNLSQSILVSGAGYSEIEAKNNCLEKIGDPLIEL
ncbi:hypothetical protein GTQ40_13505 [Flavobacteriaceae bacterium R38]|nr:hypothetical protein [Flavobacteriaceae bacterium R38]